jgi:hypothetical protein
MSNRRQGRRQFLERRAETVIYLKGLLEKEFNEVNSLKWH